MKQVAQLKRFKSNKQEKFNYIFGFMLNPFISLVFFIKNFSRVPNPKTLIVLYSAFIGFAFFISPGGDINRYIDFFINYDNNLSEYIDELTVRYNTDSGVRLDFYLETVSLLLKPFTNNVTIFLIVLGLIFGAFYSSYLTNILKNIKKIDTLTALFIFFFIIAINPQLAINSRFYAASACSLAGFYGFLLNGNKKSMLLILLSIFIHLGSSAFIILYIIIFLLKNRPFTALVITCITLSVSTIDLSSFSSYFAIPGLSGVEYKLTSYSSERAQDNYNVRFGGEAVWFMKLKARSFFTASFILLVYFYIKKIKKFDERTRNLYVTALLSVSFWQLINSFPMIYRYEPLLVVMISSFFIQLNGNYTLSREQKKIQYLIVPFMGLFAFISFRTFLGAIPLHFFISNPFVEAFLESSADVYSFFFS